MNPYIYIRVVVLIDIIKSPYIIPYNKGRNNIKFPYINGKL